MTVEEAQELATRIVQEELGPKVYVGRGDYGYDEANISLPFPYFTGVTFDDLKSASTERVERALRAACKMTRQFIAAGIEKHDADEQERMWREKIARRLNA